MKAPVCLATHGELRRPACRANKCFVLSNACTARDLLVHIWQLAVNGLRLKSTGTVNKVELTAESQVGELPIRFPDPNAVLRRRTYAAEFARELRVVARKAE